MKTKYQRKSTNLFIFKLSDLLVRLNFILWFFIDRINHIIWSREKIGRQ